MMAELDTNVAALRPGRASDPTNALRQRRHRKRKARQIVTAPARRGKIAHVEKPNDIKSDVTVFAPARNAADVAAYIAATALAGAAAWFSIRGMVVLFPGSPLSAIGVAVAMEKRRAAGDRLADIAKSYAVDISTISRL
jgi:hypothetical protein